MTDLERKEQLIFSSENINNNVAVFGSKAQTGTMEFSNDPNIIQGINNNGINWNNGWSSAVLNGSSPLMEDFNAISYVNSYNLAYLLQKGIAEWSENTTYFKGNICMVIDSEFKPVLYYSYSDNNKGNNPVNDTDGINWRQFQVGGGSGAPVGTLIKSTIPLNNANLHLADGSQLSYNGIYKEFYDYMLTLYNNEAIQPYVFCTAEEYETSINNYGNCGKYVFVENQYIKLPTINGWIETTTTINNIGAINEAGLPNIEATWGSSYDKEDDGYNSTGAIISNEIADTIYHMEIPNIAGKGYVTRKFDASIYNSIYGKSTTVQPQGIKYLVYIVLGTVTNTQVEVDINNVINDINVINTNINNINNNITALQKSYVIETYYDDNNNWYRKYNDGWVEQGGLLPVQQTVDFTVNFMVPFRDIYYSILKCGVARNTGQGGEAFLGFYNKTTSNAQTCLALTYIDTTWYAFGFYK